MEQEFTELQKPNVQIVLRCLMSQMCLVPTACDLKVFWKPFVSLLAGDKCDATFLCTSKNLLSCLLIPRSGLPQPSCSSYIFHHAVIKAHHCICVLL